MTKPITYATRVAPSGATVVLATGRLNLTVAGSLRGQLSELISAGHVKLLVDLSHADAVDSSGIGALIASLKAARPPAGTCGSRTRTSRSSPCFGSPTSAGFCWCTPTPTPRSTDSRRRPRQRHVDGCRNRQSHNEGDVHLAECRRRRTEEERQYDGAAGTACPRVASPG